MQDIYTLLAPFYDALNGEIDYEAWADFLEREFGRYFPRGVREVLDLACGTGSMSLALARRGYDMVALDSSPEMLAVARARAEEAGLDREILYLCQDMCDFELYGTVDAVVSSLDSVNHITDRAALRRMLALVHNYLVPNGLFLFDVNSPYKFSEIYGQRDYVLEADGVVCAWQNDYRPRSGLCDFYITLFSEEKDGRYVRQDAHRRERAYSLKTLGRLLRESGFELLSVVGDLEGSEINDRTERYYIAARAIKENV